MTLANQFPDISINMQVESKLREKRANLAVSDETSPALARYYEKEFRKWHTKLFFIIAGVLTVVYFIILNSYSVLKWFIS